MPDDDDQIGTALTTRWRLEGRWSAAVTAFLLCASGSFWAVARMRRVFTDALGELGDPGGASPPPPRRCGECGSCRA